MSDAETPLNPTANLMVIIDRPAETVEIMFYKDEADTDGILLGMSGSLEYADQIVWLAQSAAAFHHIEFTKASSL